jgi:hypothetical protein
MVKRAFERRDGRLWDTYRHRGKTHVQELLGSDELSPAPRPADATIRGQEGRDAIERALSALNAGDPAAPYALLGMTDDPRVATALLTAAKVARSAVLANVAHVLGQATVEGSAAILEQRMAELVSDPRTFARTGETNWRAVALSSVASALLNLAPERTGPADALVRMLDHPNKLDRRTAAAAVAESLQRGLPTEMAHRLEKELERLLQDGEAEMFGAIASGVAVKEPEVVLTRCERMLASPDLDIREIATAVLVKLQATRVRDILVAHLPGEVDLRLACTIAEHVGQSAPETLRASLARRALADESPSLRYQGMALVAWLDPDLRRRLVEEALADEPDVFLRSRLENMASATS